MERRKHQRFAVNAPCKLHFAKFALEGAAVNMSRGGFLIRVSPMAEPHPLRVGDTLIVDTPLSAQPGSQLNCLRGWASILRVDTALGAGGPYLALAVNKMAFASYPAPPERLAAR